MDKNNKRKDVEPSTISYEKRWTTLRSDYLVRRPWLTARRDTVQLPDGRVNDEYYVLEYPDWVNVIALTTDGKMVMERQYRYAAGLTCYELPCGVAELGEEPLAAAQRELLEETGYGGGHWQPWMCLAANPGSLSNMTYTFLATGVEPMAKPHLDATEELTVHLMDTAEVKAILERNEIVQALMAAPLWKFFFEG